MITFEMVVLFDDLITCFSPFAIKNSKRAGINDDLKNYIKDLGFDYEIDYHVYTFTASKQIKSYDNQPTHRLRFVFKDHSKAMLFKMANQKIRLKTVT